MILDNENMAQENSIKVGMLVKRSQQKKSIGPVNYKERVFVLTKDKLSYHEGDLNHIGKLKGTVNITAIKFVGPLDDKALSKPCSFQIVHKDYFLYCTARNQNERDDWIDALQKACSFNTLNKKYHSQIYTGRTWNCCGKSGKDAPGCHQLQKAYPTHLPLPDLPTFQHKPSISVTYKSNSHGQQHIPLPALPAQSTDNPPIPPPRKQLPVQKEFRYKYIVMALYNFQPYEPNDIELKEGLKYYVLDDTKLHWWLVCNEDNMEGYVPANYVKVLKDKNDINSMDWFQKDLSRPQAEKLLLSEEKEGCFVVRKSSQPNAIYTLSIASKGGVINGKFYVKHYHIKKSADGEYFYISESHMKPSVVELIQYHQHDSGGLITRLRHAPHRFNHSAVPLHMFDDENYEINFDDLELLDELGSGQFGVVRLARYQQRQKVAVKMMREGAMEEDSFIEEAEVMTKLKHDNLVQLYGVVTKQRPICIVTEFMENGCLLNYIRSHRQLLSQPLDLLDMCLQICDAMRYLEKNNLIHRDLAARNCLVTKNNIVKVSDFGLTRFVPDDEYTTSAGSKFPIKWASPEVLQYAKFSSKSDVWAFGVLMWELYSGGKQPYVAWSNSEVAEQVVVGYHLLSPSYCPNNIYAVMKDTWIFEPQQRPTFADIYERIYSLLE